MHEASCRRTRHVSWGSELGTWREGPRFVTAAIGQGHASAALANPDSQKSHRHYRRVSSLGALQEQRLLLPQYLN